jgi:hypothetical protein
MDSQKTRYWTIPKAQVAVKASFFLKEMTSPGVGPDVWLRFTQIREIISRAEGTIGDRTLSRALAGLVASGNLKKKAEGKYSLYSLVRRRADEVKAFARAEAAAIEGGGALGGWGDSSEGWAVFGIPEVIPGRYRSELRKECLRHREELRIVLDEVWDDAVEAILRPSRGRVSRRAFKGGEKGFENLLELEVLGSLGLGYGARFWGIAEGFVPKAPQAFQRTLGLSFAPEATVQERISVFFSKLAGKPVEEIRPAVEKEFARLEKRIRLAAAAAQPLWDSLSLKEKELAGRRLQAASAMTAALTSVVHA